MVHFGCVVFKIHECGIQKFRWREKVKHLSKYWGSSTQDDPCRSNIGGSRPLQPLRRWRLWSRSHISMWLAFSATFVSGVSCRSTLYLHTSLKLGLCTDYNVHSTLLRSVSRDDARVECNAKQSISRLDRYRHCIMHSRFDRNHPNNSCVTQSLVSRQPSPTAIVEHCTDTKLSYSVTYNIFV